MDRAAFYFDLGSPYAWLSAERIDELFEESELEPPEWKPVLLGGLFREFGRSSWAQTESREEGIAEIEKRAADYGLPPVKWPDPWPDSYLYAMRAATWADQQGHGVTFALTAFRHAFVDGFDIARPENVQAAAALDGLDPEELDRAVQTLDVKEALKANTADAASLKVSGVPSFLVGAEVFWGDDRLDDALSSVAGTD
ncbi:MAG: 2-hydroxychromene-2-carboxylate isomerase [Solirubrobacterales bacterium]